MCEDDSSSIDYQLPEVHTHAVRVCACTKCEGDTRLATYFPNWWTFSLWSAFRVWYAATDPQRETGFTERCAAGITREYM
jgi:hypothetical protein